MPSSPPTWLQRRAGPRLLQRAGAFVAVGLDGTARALEGDAADLARALLEELAVPRSREQLRAFVEEATGQVVEPGGVVDELVDALIGFGAVGEVAAPSADAVAPRRAEGPPRVVLALTGAVHSLLAPSMILALQARGFEVRVAASRAALRLVQTVGLEAMTHRPVVRSMWSRDPAHPVPHLEVAAWADLVVVCPASATTLSRLARGDFGDVVAAIALSTKAPVLLAPSMNEAMHASPSVRRNLAQLVEDGFWVVAPGAGIEVADAPGARRTHVGTAPDPETLAELVRVVLGRTAVTSASADPVAMPRDGAAWEALWSQPTGGARAWEEDALDPAATKLLMEALGAPGRALEIGAGHGLFARALAERGHRVVATDVAPTALQRAREIVGDDVTLLRDDVTCSALVGPFDVVVDRACFHALPAELHAAYAANLARVLRPGGTLAVVVDAGEAPPERATHRLDEATMRQTFGGAFELTASLPTTLAHRGAQAAAQLFLLTRG